MPFYIHSVILVLALNFQLYDCLLWSSSLPYLQTAWVNNSASIILSWQYQITPADIVNSQVSMRVRCGYINGADLMELVSRKGDTGSMTTTNQFIFGSRVEVVSFNNSRIVGFKINNVQKNDPIQYRCEAVVTQTDAPNSFNSPTTSIQVLDRPSFVNCLNGLPAVVSNQDLQITCQVVGNPTPNLYCQLLSYTGSVLNTLPQAIPSQQNITQLSFKAVQPEAEYINCVASHDITGSAVLRVPVIVKHPPFAPRSFDVTSSSKTSLHLTWPKIPQNETGTEFSYYIIEYYISRLGVLNKTTIKVQDDGSSSPKMHYNLIGLIKEQYTIVIYGVNSYGSGPPITMDAYPSDVKPETGSLNASKTGAIVGAVIGGVVAAIIIAVIIIWITKRSDKNKRYPMSYVEDAVDYPLNQDKSLYAGVDKKKKTASRKDSTSGYPDVVIGADDGQKTSYEMSSKVYV
ncbi:uncharacterized protein LOC100208944 isoform X2 [Hydra vulgaris]|uniref:Uncharacterized protein LOC100208944 isoform X2 n=1 Tax=Hydra vulgaris TaxID=6087 RepID=A0ABM4B5V9_HYDVU